MAQRHFRAGPTPFERRASRIGWLANLAAIGLGIAAAYRFPAGRIYWQLVPDTGIGLFLLGVLVRWYAALRSGPNRDTRLAGAAGRLLTVLGLSLAMRNWASILILFLPNLALTFWHLRSAGSFAAGKSGAKVERP